MAWDFFPHSDVGPELAGYGLPAKTEEEVNQCKEECLCLGFSGFVVRRGQATFRKSRREELLEGRSHGLFDRGADLYVAPEREVQRDCDVVVAFGDLAFDCQGQFLQANSGYFAAAMRHEWSDGLGEGKEGSRVYRFQDFPGDRPAFSLAMSWFACPRGVGPPWPLSTWQDFCFVFDAAVYLDSLALLLVAARSFRLAAGQSSELELGAKLAVAAGHFRQEEVVSEMQTALRALPKHQLRLMTELTETPAVGLAALELFESAPETLVSHLKTVKTFMVGAGADNSSPHSFAVELFQRHEAHFGAGLVDLRRLLRHVDAGKPIGRPLAFRLARLAHAAAQEEGAENVASMALQIFERGLAGEADPVDACDAACLSLFSDADSAPALLLDTLARPSIPSAAAAVILSRVLSSWNLEGDAAATIFDGFVRNRAGLRSFVALSEPSEELKEASKRAADLAVPELRAAFAWAAKRALGDLGLLGELGESCQCEKLLFRFLFRPTGGLPGVRFPLKLLSQLPRKGPAVELAAQRVLEELRRSDGDRWLRAQEAWNLVAWEELSDAKVEAAAALLREWLIDGEGNRHDASAVELLRALPLARLAEPEVLLAPPVPAHALAILGLQRSQEINSRLAHLEAENLQLRQELARFRSGQETR